MVRRLEVSIEKGRLQVSRVRRGEVEWSAEAAFGDVADLEAALQGVTAAEGWRPVWRADVLVGADVIQRRVLRGLPPVREAALRDLIALQQGRFFRRNGVPLATNARWIEGEGGNVEAVAAGTDLLDAIARGLESTGARKVSICTAGSSLSLESPHLAASGTVRRHRISRVLGVLAILSWLSAPVIHVVRLLDAERTLARELVTLEGPSVAVRRARRELSRASEVVEQIENGLRLRAQLPALIGAIIAALPDSASLTSLTLSTSGSGTLTAVALQPSIYVSRLERVSGIGRPAMDGASVPEPGAGRWEAFSLRWNE